MKMNGHLANFSDIRDFEESPEMEAYKDDFQTSERQMRIYHEGLEDHLKYMHEEEKKRRLVARRRRTARTSRREVQSR